MSAQEELPLAIEISNLTYALPSLARPLLQNISLSLPQGSRCILVGANGAGKSTLLQILAGKKMLKDYEKANVLGNQVFFNTPPGLIYLGTEWASNPVVRSDLKVEDFLNSIGGYRHKSRRDLLLSILDVDVEWHMHQVSDGERRRVQIVAGLMAPWSILLLDEVTVDLDVLVRSRLISFLYQETVQRNATVVYATHIFDPSLDSFPTHVFRLVLGENVDGTIEWGSQGGGGDRLYEAALRWLAEDEERRKRYESEGRPGFRRRGAIESTDVEGKMDSETFYRKYDYWKQ
ncbi:P-loop containing nucleoside triphosphate hydrolase protein [Atractiella rhizophila]|nr:P-loop containing nucleoside triphosphate hydrolase protein [Atractiella rhizophila]